ncbi:hypothetical protein N8I77_010408 [Diaporthe amygdali]|uniref:Uncharacterized protein n=1 Tax=Phomopsis amygdali TaxID=1214568 RepID=A0AAD9W0Y9_PHOAM|nr:hypothetical protein N8I77_010408 [Diaporthe amygdali]
MGVLERHVCQISVWPSSFGTTIRHGPFPYVEICGVRVSMRCRSVGGRGGTDRRPQLPTCVFESRNLVEVSRMLLTNINSDSSGREHPDREVQGTIQSLEIYFVTQPKNTSGRARHSILKEPMVSPPLRPATACFKEAIVRKRRRQQET